MPLSSLLFRRKPDAASTNKPHQQLMHRSLPNPPPTLHPPPLLPAVITQKPLLGLETAIADARIPGEDEQRRRCVKRGSVFSSFPSVRPSSSSTSSFMTPSPMESDLRVGLDHKEDDDDHDEEDKGWEEEQEEEGEEGEGDDEERCCWASYGRRSGVRRLPPPITVLAKAGGKRCIMPWVLRRSYEDGGRLVMREVKVENQEYLKPCRAGGKLTLKLFHLQEPLSPGTSSLTARTQEKGAPTALVSVPASTPQNHHEGVPTPPMQSPLKLPPSSSEKEGSTESPPRAARCRQVCSREDGVADVHRRRGALRLATLSSSLPEASTKGCYVNARPDSLFGMVAAARMPPVHS